MLSSFIATIPSTLEQGLIYAILALGIMLTYTILDFPDLTVDGSFPLGGAVTLTLLQAGHGPVTALLAAMVAGALAGLCTGLIHVKLKVRALFSGIIMMTALYSINLRITGGQALLTLPRTATTLFRNNALVELLPANYSLLIIVAALALLLKLLLDAYLKTRAGFLLRAVGDNETVVTSLARDKGNVKIAGLVMANALVALSGAVLCQSQRMFEVSMGTGAMVMGLASVIIGTNLFKRLEWVKPTSAAIAGAFLYRLCVAAAITLGLSPMDMKLVTAALFLCILAGGNLKKEKKHA